MKKQWKHYRPEEKSPSPGGICSENELISNLCDELGLQP